MPTITPTVGRKVHFYADDKQVEPHDATVIKVLTPAGGTAHPNTHVNLSVKDPDTGVARLERELQAFDEPMPFPHYRWMDYQKGQAARADAAEKRAATPAG